jgi:hypothetical protein
MRRTDLERFEQFYIPVTETGCWLWTGSEKGHGGYGGFKYKNKTLRAHRVSYELHVGPIPPGLTLDHLCRVRFCVNPKHLEPVTHKENSLRGYGVGAINFRKTHCIHGHEFNKSNTRIRTDGRGRECLACKRVQYRTDYLKLKHAQQRQT